MNCNCPLMLDLIVHFSSDDMDSILQRYSAYDGSYEALTNNEVLKMRCVFSTFFESCSPSSSAI